MKSAFSSRLQVSTITKSQQGCLLVVAFVTVTHAMILVTALHKVESPAIAWFQELESYL